MAIFEYTAMDPRGNIVNGVYDNIDSTQALRDELSKMSYSLIKARQEKIIAPNSRVSQADIVAFAYEFAGMFSAGLTVVKCLETYEIQTENTYLSRIIKDVRKKVELGLSLKEAFEKYRSVFSDFFIGMIEAGETGGKLAETLEMAARYLEKQNSLKNKIKSAFAYPTTVAVMCIIIVTALVTFVVPVFQKVYSQLHVELPFMTKVLVGTSQSIRSYWWIYILVIIGAFFAIRHYHKLSTVRKYIDSLKLSMPVFGNLNCLIISSRFFRTLSMMLSAGVGVVEAIELSSRVVNNQILTKIANEIKESIMTGGTLSEQMNKYEIFPPLLQQLATAGEQTGHLPEMLSKGVDFLDVKIDRIINSILVKIEPIMAVLLGIVVGAILIGVYLPMFDYMGQIE